jgi:predicted nucleic acid-binding Zn ribbon protein
VTRRAPRPMSLALGALTESLAPATTLARVQRVWHEALGESIAEAGRPTAERDGTLTVICADSVWAAELDLMSTELLASLNRALGGEPIRRLRCRTL